MPYKGVVDEMRKLVLAITFLVLPFQAGAGERCGGIGYRGVEDSFCLKCHRECPSIHPIFNVKVKETKCLKVPSTFPLRDSYLACTTCHDMTSSRKYFLRATKPLVYRTDFCFECHVKECYRKFNPHKTIISEKLSKKEKLKACAYCHGVGAKEEAYLACVGCHTETPHAGAIEHLRAKRKDVEKLTKGVKEIVDIESMKEVKPKLKLEELKRRKPKMYLVKGRIECITCHNPHPQIAVKSGLPSKEVMEVARRDFEFKLEKLQMDAKRFKFNDKQVSLMSRDLRSGKLCKVCHPIKSLR